MRQSGERGAGSEGRPGLSVVIPSHSRADLLDLCLRSVTAHAPAGTEILVVDDGSPDGVVSVTALRFPGVTVLRNARPVGFAAAANRGVRAARAPVVELLNDDTEVTAGWADAALTHFADPAVVAVAPLVLCGPPRDGVPVIDSAGDEYDLGGFARKRGHGRRLCHEFRVGGRVFGASASSAFYRRDAILAAGAFPESFGAYFEDVDLACRLRRFGEAVYEPASVVWHRVSASYGRRPGWRTLERQSRNEERLFWRNSGRRHLMRHAAVLAGKAVKRAFDGGLLPFLFGRLRAWAV